jgi:hypothetical protein
MPAKSTSNGTPPAVVSGVPIATRHDPNLAAAGRQPAADASASTADRAPAPAERLTDEQRTQRRRQRAAAHDASTPPRKPGRALRRERPTESASALTSSRGMTLRDSTSITLIAVLAAGGVLGAILGALSASGWIIGLLVAGLTVVLSAMVRRYSRST